MNNQYSVIATNTGQDFVLEHATGRAYVIIQTDKRAKQKWRKQKMRTLVRDNFTCQYPGCTVTDLDYLTVHHVKPREAGGKDDLPNLLTLCTEHHNETHRAGGAQ